MGETVASGYPKISVIVCTHDRPQLLETCLDAVVSQDYPNFEVVVVDNAPRMARAESIAERFGAMYRFEETPGVGIASNLGAKLASGDILAYVDDDGVPEPGWLAAIADEFSEPAIAVVTGPIHALSGNEAEELAWVAAGGTGPGELERQTYSRQTPHWFELTNSGSIGSGSNMAFAREIFFTKLGGFDPRLGVGGPMPAGHEALAFLRLLALGYKIRFTPNARVRHPFPADAESIRRRYIRGVTESSCYFTLLVFEHPRYALRVPKMMLARLGGWRPSWSQRYHVDGVGRPMSRLRSLQYWAQGFFEYWKARFTTSNHHS
ncbi:MAG TPA: glycosyltransferase family 2 protein [Terracidiphilus sp.]|nr:glycosyltransferase family 2 protein [Terracidiphilus sp.]